MENMKREHVWAVIGALFVIATVWRTVIPNSNIATLLKNEDQGPQILGTRIGREQAAQEFRSHVACFSESGSWQYDDTPRSIPWNAVAENFVNKCDERHIQVPGNVAFQDAEENASQGKNWTLMHGDDLLLKDTSKVREGLKWMWKSNSSCPMADFNRTELCLRIGSKRNVLIVGDSINHEIQWVVLNNLGLNMSGKTPTKSAVRSWQGEEVCADVLGGVGFKVGWIRNDRLSPIDQESLDSFGNFYEWPWVRYLEEWDIKILLLNRGAHYEQDGVFVRALRDIFSLLQARYPDLLVIYRDTPPGHVNCTDYEVPIKEPQREEDLPASWHWGDFRAQNLLSKKIVEVAGYVYMDVYSMLSLRPDGHLGPEDCLHYCLPGPLDVVVHLLHNVFLLL